MVRVGSTAASARFARARRLLRLTAWLLGALLFLELGLVLARPAALEDSLARHRAPPPYAQSLAAAEALPADPDRTIVHCLGDSATLGGGSASAEAYPGPLQDLLGDGFLVLNLGMAGAGVSQAAAASAEVALRLPPAVLILLPGCDDPSADRRMESQRRQGALRRALGQCGSWFLRHSRLAQFVPLLAGRPGRPGAPPGPAEPAAAQLSALDALAAASALAESRLLVVLLEDLAATPALAEHCQTRQVPFLRLAPLRAEGSAALPLLGPPESRRLAQAVHLALMTGEGVEGRWEALH